MTIITILFNIKYKYSIHKQKDIYSLKVQQNGPIDNYMSLFEYVKLTDFFSIYIYSSHTFEESCKIAIVSFFRLIK